MLLAGVCAVSGSGGQRMCVWAVAWEGGSIGGIYSVLHAVIRNALT